jgi:F-type H+-transporting ATPase subunit gamma
METLETLAETLDTIGDIQSIVRTMKSLSAVSIRQYEQAEKAISGYGTTVDLGLSALLQDRRARGLSLPDTIGSDTQAEAVVVIGSDRGLCGRYNEIVTRRAIDRIGDRTMHLAAIGAQAAVRLEGAGHSPDHLFLLPGSVGGLGTLVHSVIVTLERWMRDSDVGRISLIHNRREGRSRSVAVERALLPIPDSYLRDRLDTDWPGNGLPFFRMDPERLLSSLVRQRLFVVLYRALAEALASEHATRLAAMQSAERNIEDRRNSLNSAYRRKRQETITRELLDVVSGFEAVSGGIGQTPPD